MSDALATLGPVAGIGADIVEDEIEITRLLGRVLARRAEGRDTAGVEMLLATRRSRLVVLRERRRRLALEHGTEGPP